jgi:CubicO group peptidase (beta-lactamase class C family)
MGPAGTVRCSLADLALYTSAHLSGELGRPTDIKLKQDSWRRLHTALPDQNYGLGWFVFFKGWARGDVLQHTGSNLKWYSNVWVAPRRDFLVIVLTNAGGDTALKATGEVVEKIINKYY